MTDKHLPFCPVCRERVEPMRIYPSEPNWGGGAILKVTGEGGEVRVVTCSKCGVCFDPMPREVRAKSF